MKLLIIRPIVGCWAFKLHLNFSFFVWASNRQGSLGSSKGEIFFKAMYLCLHVCIIPIRFQLSHLSATSTYFPVALWRLATRSTHFPHWVDMHSGRAWLPLIWFCMRAALFSAGMGCCTESMVGRMRLKRTWVLQRRKEVDAELGR